MEGWRGGGVEGWRGGRGIGREGKGREGGVYPASKLSCRPDWGEGWVGWGSERPCSQARPGEGFAAQHNFFSSYFYKNLDSK